MTKTKPEKFFKKAIKNINAVLEEDIPDNLGIHQMVDAIDRKIEALGKLKHVLYLISKTSEEAQKMEEKRHEEINKKQRELVQEEITKQIDNANDMDDMSEKIKYLEKNYFNN